MPIQDPETKQFISNEEAIARGLLKPEDRTKPAEETPKEEKPKEEKKQDLPGVRNFAKSFLGTSEEVETPKEEKPKEEKKKDQDPAAGKPAAKPEEKPKVAPKVAPKPSAPDPLARAAGALEKAADAITKSTQRPAAEEHKEEKKDDDLPTESKRKFEVLQQMEKMWPDKYKDRADTYRKSTQKLIKYAQDWETKNPGREFNEDDQEHENFFKANDVNWDDDDYIEALTEMKTVAAVEKANRETNEKLSDFQRKEALREAEPLINKEQTAAATTLWKEFGEDFAGVIDADGSVNREKLKALKETDIGLPIRLQSAQRVDGLVADLYKLVNGLQPFDEKKPSHIELNDFALDMEEELLKRPETERLDESGRSFKPREEFNKLSAKEQRDHWTFGVSDLSVLLAYREAEKAKKIIASKEEEFSAYAKAKGIELPKKEDKGGIEEVKEADDESEDEHGKPRSPTASSVPKVAATKQKTTAEPKTGVAAFGQKFMGG